VARLTLVFTALLLLVVGCGNQMPDAVGQHVLKKEGDQWKSSAHSQEACAYERDEAPLMERSACDESNPQICCALCVGPHLCDCGGTLGCCIEACDKLCGPYPQPEP